MICRNCNYILSGSEQFCPHCGANLPQTTNNVPDTTDSPKPPPIFTSEKVWDENELNTTPSHIFSADNPQEFYETKSGKKKKTAVILCLCLLLVLLCSGAVYMLQNMDITPVLSAVIPTKSNATQTDQTTTSALITTMTSQVNKDFGIMSPEIIYKPVNCFVSGASDIQLRKGPHNAYGIVASLSVGQQLQIIGGSMLSDEWYYVYLPTQDCYGWINGAYLSRSDSVEQAVVNNETGENETSKNTSDETTDTTESATQ